LGATTKPTETYGIVMAPCVELLRQRGIDCSDQSIRFYPDGAMVCRANTDFYLEARAAIRHSDPDCEALVYSRPLAPFVGHDYYISYPGWYAVLRGKYTEQGMFVAPGVSSPPLRCEYDLERVSVSIRVFRRMRKVIPQALADALKTWFAEIGSKGVFGEAGVTALSQELRHSGKDAAFGIDASQSGEHTLNTLLLAIIDWAMDCQQPLELVSFVAARPQFHEWDEGPHQYQELLHSGLIVPLR
jgi:hypothetical protein